MVGANAFEADMISVGDKVKVKKGRLTPMTRKFIGMVGEVTEKKDKMGSVLYRVTFVSTNLVSSACFFGPELEPDMVE